MTHLQFKGKCFLLELSFNIFLLIFRKNEYKFFLGTNKLIGITLTILTLRLWEYLLRLTLSRLTSPVWAPPTVQLRRMTVFESFFF